MLLRLLVIVYLTWAIAVNGCVKFSQTVSSMGAGVFSSLHHVAGCTRHQQRVAMVRRNLVDALRGRDAIRPNIPCGDSPTSPRSAAARTQPTRLLFAAQCLGQHSRLDRILSPDLVSVCGATCYCLDLSARLRHCQG